MIQIAVDVMGGDHAPDSVLLGCRNAIKKQSDIQLHLVGPEKLIAEKLAELQIFNERMVIHPAEEVILTDEAPVDALRKKKNSSIVVGLELLRENDVSAFVSAGNTGAVLAGGLLIVRCMEGIRRPALAPVLPTTKGPMLLIDAGANMDVKPINLLQFALMGSVYMQQLHHIEKPKVGLLNIGSEQEKGNELVKDTYERMEKLPIHFIGNVEARDVPYGVTDVLVCDGFVGNVLLKYMEGLSSAIFSELKKEFSAKAIYKIGALLLKPAFQGFKKKQYDVSGKGGAVLLGLNGCVIKTHGSSDARAIESTILQAREFIHNRFVDNLKEIIMQAGML